jgi:anti-sigma regulatory factor (Ser/Thr protein kinase)
MAHAPTDAAIHLALPCAPVAPRLAREALSRILGRSPNSEDAALVVSELVTNAVAHSGCEPGQTIILDAALNDACVRIAVHDPGRSVEIPRARDRPGDIGGLGLRLVEQLARRWGSERADGRVVWAELAR